jgi:hypothetical protein
MNYTIGIDPGAKGGWAALDEAGAIVSVGTDIRAADVRRASKVVLEAVHSSPLMGVSSAFSFGESFGWIKGYLDALGVVPVLVSPQKWQKVMGGAYEGLPPKERARAFALERWNPDQFILPRCKVPNDGVVDAALIALWALGQDSKVLEFKPVKKKISRRPMKF